MAAPKGNKFWMNRKKKDQPSEDMSKEAISHVLAKYYHRDVSDAIIIEDKKMTTQEEIDEDLKRKFPPGEAERIQREEEELRQQMEEAQRDQARRDQERREREERDQERREREERDQQQRDQEQREREEKQRAQRARWMDLSKMISASLVLAIIAHSLPLMYIGVRALLNKFMPDFTLRKLSKEGYKFLMFTEEDLQEAGLEPLIEEVVEVYFLDIDNPWLIAGLSLAFSASMKITMMHQDDDKEKYFTND